MPSPRPRFRFRAIGTAWEIETAEPLEAEVADAVLSRCEEFDRGWSRFRSDSVVSRAGSTPGTHVMPPDAAALFELYRRFYVATAGAMSPLVGRALEQWGYDRTYRLRPAPSIDPVPAWDDAIAWDGTHLDVLRPVVVDVGAAGKGFLVDALAELLTDAKVASHTIDASGDIHHRADRPLRVALEHPADPSRAVGVASVRSGAIAASAVNRRAWPGAHHVLDGITGLPTERVVATWAAAPTAAVADGLATALFFVDAEELTEEFEFEWVRMLRSGVVEHSPGFDGELFA